MQGRKKDFYKEHLVNIKITQADNISMNLLNYTVLEDSPDYKLVVTSQQLLMEIEDEKDNAIQRIAELY